MSRLTLEMLGSLKLLQGKHTTREEGTCLIEAVAWFNGEEHGDHPRCVCPVIAAFARAINDRMPDPPRTELLVPLIPKLGGTRISFDVEVRRAQKLLDVTIREFTPDVLASTLASIARALMATGRPEAASLVECAKILRTCNHENAKDELLEAARVLQDVAKNTLYSNDVCVAIEQTSFVIQVLNNIFADGNPMLEDSRVRIMVSVSVAYAIRTAVNILAVDTLTAWGRSVRLIEELIEIK